MRSAGFARAASWATLRRRCCRSSDWRCRAPCPATTSGGRRGPVLLHPAEEGPGQLGLAHQEVEFVVAGESGARPVAATEEGDPSIEDPERRVQQLVSGLAIEAYGGPGRLEQPEGGGILRLGGVQQDAKVDTATRGRDERLEDEAIVQNEHLDVDRVLGGGDCRERGGPNELTGMRRQHLDAAVSGRRWNTRRFARQRQVLFEDPLEVLHDGAGR